MSAVAGIILILLGGASLALGVREIMNPDKLTPLVAGTTAGLGFVLIVVGLLHFRAPHKSFLLTIPILLFLHYQMYINALFYYNDPRWICQGVLAIISILVVILSYKGYVKSSAKAKAANLPA